MVFHQVVGIEEMTVSAIGTVLAHWLIQTRRIVLAVRIGVRAEDFALPRLS